jgi:transposase InsO family protein
MTDNAWAYRWSLREVRTAHDIQQKFIKPHCPWQNGKVERLNRTLTTEWAYHRTFTTNNQRAAALAPWLNHYSTTRHHSALGGQPPHQPAATNLMAPPLRQIHHDLLRRRTPGMRGHPPPPRVIRFERHTA